MNLTCFWHMGVGLSWDWRIGDSRTGERELFLEMLPDLPPEALVVADAGFTGFDFLNAVQASGRFFLIRVGSNVELLRELGAYRREGPDTVYLWPEAHRERPPLTLRLIQVGSVSLITNVLDRTRMTPYRAGLLYRLRWGVEVGFRTLKQTLDRRTMRCAAPAQAKMELNWSVLGLTLVGLMSVAGLKRRRVDPLEWSPAASLRVLRRWRRLSASHRCGNAGARDELLRDLGRCVKDRYPRACPKKSWSWPHKKNPPPPGAPTIVRATKAIRARAALAAAA
jgi:Transposase DDE domain